MKALYQRDIVVHDWLERHARGRVASVDVWECAYETRLVADIILRNGTKIEAYRIDSGLIALIMLLVQDMRRDA